MIPIHPAAATHRTLAAFVAACLGPRWPEDESPLGWLDSLLEDLDAIDWFEVDGVDDPSAMMDAIRECRELEKALRAAMSMACPVKVAEDAPAEPQPARPQLCEVCCLPSRSRICPDCIPF